MVYVYSYKPQIMHSRLPTADDPIVFRANKRCVPGDHPLPTMNCLREKARMPQQRLGMHGS